MIELPAYNIIQFIEWIKTNPRKQGDIGYARECIMIGKHNYKGFEGLITYAKQFIEEMKLDIEPAHLINSFSYFLYSDYAKSNDKIEIEMALWHMDESEFVQSLDVDGSPFLMHSLLQTPKKMPLSLGIDFLQWIIDNVPIIQIKCMPFTTIEKMIEAYLFEQYGENYSMQQKKQLVNFFKLDNPQTLFDKIRNIFVSEDVGKVKGMNYIIDRFYNPQIYKCMFLPLDSDREFEKFINEYWINIHELSRDWLDIYYSKDELLLCGYKIIEELKKLNPPLSALPCLVLWKDSLLDARYIELRGLKFQEEVYHIIQVIVDNIRRGLNLDEIYEGAVIMSDEKRNNHNPIIHVSQTANTVNGAMIGVSSNSSIEVQATNTVSDGEFNRQLNEAIDKINSFEEITSKQKEYLVTIMHEAKSSVDETQKQMCKEKFNAFMLGMGNVSLKIISALSGLSSIARFFGLGL